MQSFFLCLSLRVLHLGYRAYDAVNVELAQLPDQVEPCNTGFVNRFWRFKLANPTCDFRKRVLESSRADFPDNRIERNGGDRACVNVETN